MNFEAYIILRLLAINNKLKADFLEVLKECGKQTNNQKSKHKKTTKQSCQTRLYTLSSGILHCKIRIYKEVLTLFEQTVIQFCPKCHLLCFSTLSLQTIRQNSDLCIQQHNILTLNSIIFWMFFYKNIDAVCTKGAAE